MIDWIDIILIASFSVVYSELLTDDGMIFSGVFNLLQKKLPGWLFKPLIGCHRCVAGQLSLWYFVFFYEYSVIGHIFFISSTILISELIVLWIQSLKN